MLSNAKSIDSVLKDCDLPENYCFKLSLVDDILGFGVNNLGFDPTASFSSVNLRDDSVMGVYVCEPDSFDLKKSNYLFFSPNHSVMFSESLALSEKKLFEKRGFDVFVADSSAYSSAGFFNDPICSSTLEESVPDFVEILFHEWTHEMIKCPKHPDFNEGVASFIGRVSALSFLDYRFGKDSDYFLSAVKNSKERSEFYGFIDDLHSRLSRVYSSDLSKDSKLSIKSSLLDKASFKLRRFVGNNGFVLNNAFIMAVQNYHEDSYLYSEVYESFDKDMSSAIDLFKLASKKKCPDCFLIDYLFDNHYSLPVLKHFSD